MHSTSVLFDRKKKMKATNVCHIHNFKNIVAIKNV